MKVFACHLYNDFSGSPKVLKQLINGWTKHGLLVTLLTSQNHGFLSNMEDVTLKPIHYRFRKHKIFRLIELLKNQINLFIVILKSARSEDTIYINTILPFGAALAGKIRGCDIVYHIHETSVTPAILKKFLFGTVRRYASRVVYVSNFLKSVEPIDSCPTYVLHNCIEHEFSKRASEHKHQRTKIENITMICSLKKYKGVFEFVDLANTIPQIKFTLVLNAYPEDINAYFESHHLPENLVIYPVQEDIHPILCHTDLMLNLSRPDEWVETFGLTIIEAMAYGIPSIVPPIGGITELIENGYNGYQINGRNTNQIANLITTLNDSKMMLNLSKNALHASYGYQPQTFNTNSLEIINSRLQ